MGKRSRKSAENGITDTGDQFKAQKSTPWNEQGVDASLAALFASSAGPVQAPPKSRYTELLAPKEISQDSEISNSEPEDSDDADDNELSSIEGDLDDADLDDLSEGGGGSDKEAELQRLLEASQKPERKRKRKAEEEDLEGKYLQKLAEAEQKEESERQAERKLKRQRLSAEEAQDGSDADDDDRESHDSGSEKEGAEIIDAAPLDNPLHETLAPDGKTTELEKATRTVFLGNVCTSAISSKPAHKTLSKHLSSFLSDLPVPPAGKPHHKVESLRFRSTPYAAPQLPKKASFAKKDVREATTKSTNAYAVYSTAYAAREAAKRLNGTIVLDRHIRVDSVAHPAKVDHKRCVFVGNLGFMDDESMLESGENERKRSKIPSDIEEGLWRQFGKAGRVESVRVVRDEKTRVGKGFAYVQFDDINAVEAALLFNEKKYPPMLPRILRVVRAKPPKSTALAQAAAKENRKQNARAANSDKIYNPRVSSEASSMHGRAGRLLGKAGASKLKKTGANDTPMGSRPASGLEGITKTPERIIFEGHRATAKSTKPKDLRMGGKKGGGKPKTKGSRRAAAWKKSGGRPQA